MSATSAIPLNRSAFFRSGFRIAFRKALQASIESIRRQVLQMSKSESYTTASKKIMTAADKEENQLLGDFENRMAAEGFKLLQIKDDDARSMDLVPLLRGKTVTFDELQERVGRGLSRQAS